MRLNGTLLLQTERGDVNSVLKMLRAFLLLSMAKIIWQASASAHSALQHHEFPEISKCVQLFDRDPIHFDRCKNTTCFVFQSEKPYVAIPENMTSEESVRLFSCKDKRKEFPGLEGLSFDVMEHLPLDDALCVYGGHNCTFTGMMEFVRNQRQHQFVAGGHLFTIPERFTENTRPSAPIADDRIVIVGRRDAKSSIAQAYTTILRPFQFSTWMMLLGIVVFFILVRLLIAAYFSQLRTPQYIAKHVLGEYDSDAPETFRLLNKGAVACLKVAVAAFFAIIVLFYEIAVVNFVFSEKKHALQKSLASLSEAEMKQYIIPKAEATEAIWRKYIGAENKYVNTTPPWHWCSLHPECVDKVLSDEHPAKLTMTYESFIRHYFKNEKACDRWTAYDTDNPLYTFSSGWYYGAVPLPTVIQTDRAILNLRMEGQIRKIFDREIDSDMSLNCAAMSTDIPPSILGWLLLTVIGMCMIPVIAIFLVGAKLKISTGRQKGLINETQETYVQQI